MRRYAVYETHALASALDVDGYARVAAALTREQCETAKRRIDALEPLHWDETRDAGGRELDRYLNVFNRDPFWLGFLDRPGIIDLAEAVLGVDCHVIGETAWRSHPGYAGDPLHVDYAPLEWPEGALRNDVRIPAFILTVHFYLDDVTADLAPTRVVAGSHRAGRAPRAGETAWNGHDAQAVLAAAGDALVFRSDVWHAGSENRTASDVRYLLQVHYGRRDMAQRYGPHLAPRFEPRVLAAATKRQRRLLGEHEPGPYE
jgi:hypothetical protein